MYNFINGIKQLLSEAHFYLITNKVPLLLCSILSLFWGKGAGYRY